MLYFDNRVRRKDVIDDTGLDQKAARLWSGKPLRLVFGGRFVPMKGVLQLPEIARNLRQLGVLFEFSIHGAGPDEESMRQKLRHYGLEAVVRICPPVDFRSGWVPFLKQEADLFVCSHLQGDPSSTYPEVMSCGVPIAGYANEAFTGIAALSGSGFLSPMGKPDKLAEAIG
jgi:colanic acid/amylovoran biosynthesis glycosyltransferase